MRAQVGVGGGGGEDSLWLAERHARCAVCPGMPPRPASSYTHPHPLTPHIFPPPAAGRAAEGRRRQRRGLGGPPRRPLPRQGGLGRLARGAPGGGGEGRGGAAPFLLRSQVLCGEGRGESTGSRPPPPCLPACCCPWLLQDALSLVSAAVAKKGSKVQVLDDGRGGEGWQPDCAHSPRPPPPQLRIVSTAVGDVRVAGAPLRCPCGVPAGCATPLSPPLLGTGR